jgi:hypothetical protein
VEKINFLMEMQAQAHMVAQVAKAETTSVAVLAEAVQVTNSAVEAVVAVEQDTQVDTHQAEEQAEEQAFLEELLFLKRRYSNGKIRRN